MTEWFTSDSHFGHENVIRYCNRPYPNKYEMDFDLIQKWNETVKDGDIVYHLGDVAMNKNRVPEIVPKLNGYKILIPGNHDKCFSMSEKWVDFYKAAGFAQVFRSYSMILADQEVVCTHLPYKSKTDVDQRYMNERLEDKGLWLLHGHTHGRWRIKHKQIDVGIDAWEYKPISKEYIENLISSYGDGIDLPNPNYNHPEQHYEIKPGYND